MARAQRHTGTIKRKTDSFPDFQRWVADRALLPQSRRGGLDVRVYGQIDPKGSDATRDLYAASFMYSLRDSAFAFSVQCSYSFPVELDEKNKFDSQDYVLEQLQSIGNFASSQGVNLEFDVRSAPSLSGDSRSRAGLLVIRRPRLV